MIKKATKFYPLLLSILVHLTLIIILISSIIHAKNPHKKERFISLGSIKIDNAKKISPIKKVMPRKKIEKKQKIVVKPKKIVVKKIMKKRGRKKSIRKKKIIKVIKKKVSKKILRKVIKRLVKKKVYPLAVKPISKEALSQPKKSIKKEYKKKKLKIVNKSKIAIAIKEKHIKNEFLKLNLSKILESINDERFYPKRARKLHIEGIVKIKFLLKKDGSIKILNISSDKKYLKKASIKILSRASKFFPKPPKEIIIRVPIEFKLLS